ncbi:Hypothetical predicted protein, partial [Pelobates cultripes]
TPHVSPPNQQHHKQGGTHKKNNTALTTLTCLSINCKGLNNPAKRHHLMRWANRSKADILLLQETHFTQAKQFPLLSRHYRINHFASSPQDMQKSHNHPEIVLSLYPTNDSRPTRPIPYGNRQN